MKAKDFDRKFDQGEDITSHLDLSKARRPGLEPKNEPRRPLLDELVSLSASIERQEQVNAAKIGVFLEALEQLFRDKVQLREDVWVDEGIWEDSSTIFGWARVAEAWHIAVGERESWVDPDGETVIYASSTKKALDCDTGVQRQAFRKAELLIKALPSAA